MNRPGINNQFEQLRHLLSQTAILYADKGHNLIDKKGNKIRWIFYNWNVSLTPEGARLTASCLLERLKDFKSTVLASYGMTSLPIVSACVAFSQGQYNALAIRDKKELHGTCRQIEGMQNKNESIVIIDDCIGTGSSAYKAIAVLESEGFKVEGCLFLVNIPFQGGIEWIKASGYRVEALFDAYKDLGVPMRDFQAYKFYNNPDWDPNYRVQNGLTPADAVKIAIGHYLKYRLMPKYPESFDKDYDCHGGAFVSLRDKLSDFRIARDGFINLNDSCSNACMDIFYATFKTVSKYLPDIETSGIEKLKVGVTMLGSPLIIQPRNIDFLKYGITIQSNDQPWKVGAALPNTQSLVSDMEQFTQALETSAHITAFESFSLYRYPVTKSIQTGYTWPASGYSQINSDSMYFNKIVAESARSLEGYMRKIITELSHRNPVNFEEFRSIKFPFTSVGIGVSLYHRGIIGCWTSFSNDINYSIFEATKLAWLDPRYHGLRDLEIEEITIVISFLHNSIWIGEMDCRSVSNKFRLGVDSLSIHHENKMAITLNYFPSHYDWNGENMAKSLLEKAGLNEGKHEWRAYSTTSFHLKNNIARNFVNGYTCDENKPVTYDSCIYTLKLLSAYLINQCKNNPLPSYCYWPFYKKWSETGTADRIILAIHSLSEAGSILEDKKVQDKASVGLQYCKENIIENEGIPKLLLPDLMNGEAAEALYLLTTLKRRKAALTFDDIEESLMKKILSFLHEDGSISVLPEGRHIGADHDFLPGIILLTVAEYYSIAKTNNFQPCFENHLQWYKRRFRLKRAWGMAWWHMQAWSSICRLTGKQEYADFVFEIADWTLNYQVENKGMFLINYSKKNPSFHTGCVLEGIADAGMLAKDIGDNQRASQYINAWKEGMGFMNQLIIKPEDSLLVEDPAYAVGGVRHSLTSSCLRIDYTAHLILAIAKGIRLIDQ